MEATLHHFSQEDLSDIRIQVWFENVQTKLCFCLNFSTFSFCFQVDYPDQTRKQGEDVHHLSTKVSYYANVILPSLQVLLHANNPWIDAALVKFTVVLMTGPGRSIPVAALESPSVRRTACVIAKVLPA